MAPPQPNLIVLGCQDLERVRLFYEAVGCRFSPEQHSGGPFHHSARLGSGMLKALPRVTDSLDSNPNPALLPPARPAMRSIDLPSEFPR